MSLLSRLMGWPSPEQRSRASGPISRGALSIAAIAAAAKDGVTVVNSPQIVHQPVKLHQLKIPQAKRFSEPQSRGHRIIFGGSDAQTAAAFTEALGKLIERGSPKGKEAHWVLHEDLNALASNFYPGRIFQLSDERTHELCHNQTLDFKPRVYHEKTVTYARQSGMTLEFCYRRPTKDGGKTFNIRRVLVTQIHGDWFRGVDARGPRNYRFDRMFGSTLDKGQNGVPVAQPQLSMLLLHGFYGQRVFMSFSLNPS